MVWFPLLSRSRSFLKVLPYFSILSSRSYECFFYLFQILEVTEIHSKLQELLEMEKTRSISLQLDGKKNKKAKPKKKDVSNGSAAGNVEGGEGSGGNVKEKCHVM